MSSSGVHKQYVSNSVAIRGINLVEAVEGRGIEEPVTP